MEDIQAEVDRRLSEVDKARILGRIHEKLNTIRAELNAVEAMLDEISKEPA